MNNALNSLENNALTALSKRATPGVVNAIKTASAKTGVSFTYLMEKAAAESNFNPTIKAKTSSATGLFQFIESTWMDMMNKHGEKHGIDTNQSKQSLLNLRKDPEIASIMAAEFAGGNKDYLQKTVGGNIGNTDLYFAHFMGAGGASSFLSQLKKNPMAIGADLFPKEANANRGVFYNKNGSARSLGQIYEFFDKKFSGDAGLGSQPETMAHKPSKKSGSVGYQHIPFSLKQEIEIIPVNRNPSYNSLVHLKNSLDAFFTSPIQNDGFSNVPSSLYGNISATNSMLLSVLK